jgi:hypothetical protein
MADIKKVIKVVSLNDPKPFQRISPAQALDYLNERGFEAGPFDSFLFYWRGLDESKISINTARVIFDGGSIPDEILGKDPYKYEKERLRNKLMHYTDNIMGFSPPYVAIVSETRVGFLEEIASELGITLTKVNRNE